MTPNLSLGNRLDPAKGKVDDYGNDANDPENPSVVRAVIAEDDSKDDTAKVSCSAGTPRNDT